MNIFLSNIFNSLPPYLSDAVIDSLKLVPFLLIIFIVIEIFENYFAQKITSFVNISQKAGPVIGALLALIPQCGFSVIAGTLYIKRFITMGSLLAVYIATSDEAIPILLANPKQLPIVWKIILIKLILAVLTGYVVDLIFKNKINLTPSDSETEMASDEKGCCDHTFNEHKMKNLVWHPIKHTFHIFLFILLVCIVLNYSFAKLGTTGMSNLAMNHSILQPVITGIIGLIPNCAISVLITMTYLKGAISFGSMIAGLTSSAGLGLLVLFNKKTSLKNFLLIVGILLFVSIFAGIILQYCKFIS